jgi:hypothetical protein
LDSVDDLAVDGMGHRGRDSLRVRDLEDAMAVRKKRADDDEFERPPLTYQIKVTLLESEPPIWRRLRVPSEITLKRLHQVLQAAMGWTDSHLHTFTAGGVIYAKPSTDWDMKVRDTARIQLRDVAKVEGEAFIYEYDLGDSWCHQVLLEEVHFDKSADRVAVCLEGEFACPLEDSGGVHGYYDTLEILRDVQHEEHEATTKWANSMAAMAGRKTFDPDAFDLGAVNAKLKQIR